MTDLSNFKPISGYEDLYLVSENGEMKIFKVHRLVALNFLDNLNNLPQINHIDGDKLNNHISNLEFCTVAYNQQHAWENGLKENARAAARKNGKIANKRAQEAHIRHLDDNLKELFDDIFKNQLKNKDIANKFNLSCPYISMIKSKRVLKTAISEYFGDKDNVISVNINELHGNVRHLDNNLKELFDDIFINKLKNKNICKKYNLEQSYVSQIKNKKTLKTALNEYFGGSK